MDLVQFIGRFHVLVLHLPLGILLMAALMEAYWAIRSRERSKTLDTVWLWGALSAVAAATLGYMLSIGGGYDPQAVDIHKKWGIALAVFALVCWLGFSRKSINTKLRRFKLLVPGLCGIQLFMLFATGHYGANMTHGSTYLVEYAPNTVRALAGLPPHEPPRPTITNIKDADVYLDIIKPALKARCISCHNVDKQKGRLDLSQYALLIKGGKSGPAVSAGDLDKSELYQRITLSSHDEKYMPADGKTPLSDEQVAAIAWWIKIGAPEQGLVQDLNASLEDKKLLAQAINLGGRVSDWPLETIAAMPTQLRIELEQHGFVVKQISQEINYVDVDFSTSTKPLTQEAVDSLVKAKDYVAWLNLSDSGVSDKQLPAVAQLSQLIKLRLDKNPVSASGIQELGPLPHLEYLNLYQTDADDKTFTTLSQMQNLQAVYLSMTKVSDEGLAAYTKATKGKVKVYAQQFNRMSKESASNKKESAETI